MYRRLIQVILEVKIILKDSTQNYLVFQPMNKYFRKISSTNQISVV